MSFLLEFLKAITGLAALLVLWLGVQVIWRRVFPDTPTDDDVLAGRMSCHGCTCTAPCENKRRAEPGLDQR